MKKLSLKSSAFNKGEVLTREQLKKVMGGDDGSGSGGGGGDSPKVKACSGKKNGDSCSFVYNGTDSYGYCRAYAPDYTLHCSNLL